MACFARATPRRRSWTNRWPMDSTLLAGNRSSVGIAAFWQRATTASQWGVLGRPLCLRPTSQSLRPHGGVNQKSLVQRQERLSCSVDRWQMARCAQFCVGRSENQQAWLRCRVGTPADELQHSVLPSRSGRLRKVPQALMAPNPALQRFLAP
jgi:hypothetical protein